MSSCYSNARFQFIKAPQKLKRVALKVARGTECDGRDCKRTNDNWEPRVLSSHTSTILATATAPTPFVVDVERQIDKCSYLVCLVLVNCGCCLW
jgi:hypothetical protein